VLKSVAVIDICNLFVARMCVVSALELGCGDGGMVARLGVLNREGIDLWQPSLDVCNRLYPDVVTRCADVREIGRLYKPRSRDLVCGFDILEHMEYLEAQRVIEAAERIAARGVMWWGPLEDTPRRFPDEPNPLMQHVRCIDLAEFADRGYELITFPNYWTEEGSIGATAFLAMKDCR